MRDPAYVAPKVGLVVGSSLYRGWKAVSIARTLEAIAGRFTVEVSERWVGEATRWPIAEGDECSLTLDGEPIISGYVDAREVSFDSSSHAVSISGRDKAAAAVDSSPDLAEWEFYDQPLDKIAKALLAPFAVPLKVQVSPLPTPRTRFALNPGESAFESLARLCRLSGVLPISDGAGGVLIVRAGTERTPTELVEGVNILSASARFSHEERFNLYTVTAQQPGSDSGFADWSAGVKATARDPAVRADRRLLVVGEGNMTPAQAKDRAEWEAANRAARSGAVTVTVQGWRMGDGKLWPLNKLVRVRSEKLGVDRDLLIVGQAFKLDEGSGTTLTLELRRPEAYTPQPEVPEDEWATGDEGGPT